MYLIYPTDPPNVITTFSPTTIFEAIEMYLAILVTETRQFGRGNLQLADGTIWNLQLADGTIWGNRRQFTAIADVTFGVTDGNLQLADVTFGVTDGNLQL